MNTRIWKWTLAAIDLQSLSLPKGAQVLTVQTQGDQPQLWALVDETARHEMREFVTHGTGHQLTREPGRYVGTYQLHDGHLVFHVFERGAS